MVVANYGCQYMVIRVVANNSKGGDCCSHWSLCCSCWHQYYSGVVSWHQWSLTKIDKDLREFEWILKGQIVDLMMSRLIVKRIMKSWFVSELKFVWWFELFFINLEQLWISEKSFRIVQVEFQILIKFWFWEGLIKKLISFWCDLCSGWIKVHWKALSDI